MPGIRKGIIAWCLVLCLLQAAALAGEMRTLTAEEVFQEVRASRGSVVVVNIFASWCPPCRKEMPSLVRFYDEYASRHGVVFLGVALDESAGELREFLDRFNVTYPVVLNGGDVLASCQSPAVPQFLVFSRDGELVRHEIGMMSFDELVASVAPYAQAREGR